MKTCSKCGAKNINSAQTCAECNDQLMQVQHEKIGTNYDDIVDAIRKMTEKLNDIERSFQKTKNISISDVSMSFGSMVVFMVKWAIASIPAAIILILIPWILVLIFGTFFGLTLR